MSGRTRNIILKITGDERDAKRAAKSVREELRRLSREEVKARIDLDTRILERKIERVKTDLTALGNRDASPEVDLKTQKALRKLDRLNVALDRLKLKRVEVDIDVKRGGLETAAAALGKLDRGGDKFFKGVGDFGRSVPVLGQMLGVVIDGFVELGNGISKMVTAGVTGLASLVPALSSLAGPIGAVVGGVVNVVLSFGSMLVLGSALVVALNAVLGAVVALGGALVALAASAAAAVGGLLAFGTAFGVAMIPALIVGIGVMTRLVAVFKAHQAQQQALTQASQEHKAAEERRQSALLSVKQAQEQLTQATVDGNHAMAQSIQDLKDAQLGLSSSKLGVKEAKLGLKEAKQSLREFIAGTGAKGPDLTKQFSNVEFNPANARKALGAAGGKTDDPLELQRRILAVQRAQLNVKDSINQTAHAEDALAEATRKRADFVARGVRAYAPYRSALNQVARAESQLAKSEGAVAASARKRDEALKKLTPTEKTALGNLDKFLDGFEKLAKAVSAPVFKALNDVWGELGKSGIDLQGALVKIGEAFGDVIRSIGGFLAEPATRSAFKVMADGAADLVRQLGARAFRSFLTIMREVAVTALPAVRSAARDVANWLERIAGKPAKIHSVVSTLVKQFKTWAGLAGALAGLVVAIFVPASKYGGQLAGSLTRIVNNWTRWIKDNPDKVRQFFRDSVQKTKDIAKFLGRAVDWLRNDLPKAAAKAKTFLDKVYKVAKAIADTIATAVKGWQDLKDIVAPGSNKLSVAARDIPKQVDTVNRLSGQLKEHQTPEHRATLRQELAQALRDLQKDYGGKLTGPTAALLNRLKSLGFDKGGLVPGSGATPATVHGGEFVLRRGVVASLGQPFLNALNTNPAAAMAGAGTAPTGGPVAFHAHITVPGGGIPDERVLIAKLGREAQKLGAA